MKGFTSGGLRYSNPMLRALFLVFKMSLIKLYRSILKLSVGPADNLTMRREGAIDVSVKARRWVTCKAGACTK